MMWVHTICVSTYQLFFFFFFLFSIKQHCMLKQGPQADHIKLAPTELHCLQQHYKLPFWRTEYMTLLTQPWPQARALVLPCQPNVPMHTHTHNQASTHTLPTLNVDILELC